MMPFRLLVAAAVLVPALAGQAAGAMGPPERASRGPLPARSPEIAMNGRGDAAAVWVRGARRDAAVVVSLRPAGEAWGEPVAISRRGRPAIDPQVAVDAHGRVVVLWRQVVRTRLVATARGRRHQAVYVARTRDRLMTDARWGSITTLSSERQKVGPPELGMSDAGLAVAAWHWGTGTSPGDRGYEGQVQFAERRSDGSWSGPRRLSRASLCVEVRLPRVAVGPRAHTVVWWQCDLPGDRSTALAVARAPDSAFGGEAELPFRTPGGIAADLAVAADGTAVAVSAEGSGALAWWRGEVGTTLALTHLPVLGTTDRSDREAGPPVIAVDDDGDALSAWIDTAGRPRAAPIAADLGVGMPSTLGPAGDATTSIRVAVGADRHGVVAWTVDGLMTVSTRGADGTVASGQTVSSRGVGQRDAPAVAMDSAGAATAMWARTVGGRSVVERSSTAS